MRRRAFFRNLEKMHRHDEIFSDLSVLAYVERHGDRPMTIDNIAEKSNLLRSDVRLILEGLVGSGELVKENWRLPGGKKNKWRYRRKRLEDLMPGCGELVCWVWKGGPRVSLPMCVGLDNGFPKAVGPPHNALPMVIRK